MLDLQISTPINLSNEQDKLYIKQLAKDTMAQYPGNSKRQLLEGLGWTYQGFQPDPNNQRTLHYYYDPQVGTRTTISAIKLSIVRQLASQGLVFVGTKPLGPDEIFIT